MVLSDSNNISLPMSKSGILEAITPILREFGVKDAALFGSYAKGTATRYSDVDIYVDSGLRSFKFCGLLDAICDALPLPVDLIDKQCVTENGPLDLEIRATGERILL